MQVAYRLAYGVVVAELLLVTVVCLCGDCLPSCCALHSRNILQLLQYAIH